MARRGGDLRPLISPYGRDLHYARLILEALARIKSPAGVRFARHRERLYRRWVRLLKGIIAYKGGLIPLSGIEDTDHDLDLLELDHKSDYYPAPTRLTPKEHACWEWRQSIASNASNDIYVNLGRPNQPPNWDGTQEPWTTWETASVFLQKWANEPAYQANRHVKRKSWRRRSTIAKYRQEVDAFCKHWRLRAWWAAPAIIQDHFFQAQTGLSWDPVLPPLSMCVVDPGPPVSFLIAVKLPGRTLRQFKDDKTKAASLVDSFMLRGTGGPIEVLRTHLSREDRANWEESIDASCITLEWEGHSHLAHDINAVPESGEGDCWSVTPEDFLVGRCRERLGRCLTYREERDIRSQAYAQMRAYRKKLGEAGWAALGNGDIRFIAGSIARMLLRPNRSWDSLLRKKPSTRVKNRYGDSRSMRRACQNLAGLARLTLPTKHPGRPAGSQNIIIR